MASRIVVLGTSSGGFKALQVLLPGLPKDFPWPLIIVQHRGKESDTGLCGYLQRWCSLPIGEPEDKETIVPGRVYLAPRDYHLLIEKDHFALSTDAPVWYARPSINVTFESAADAHGEKVIGVILTGANADGARGAEAIKRRGGMVVVEEPDTAEAPEMPAAAIARTKVDNILPLPQIAPFLASLCYAAAPAAHRKTPQRGE